MNDHAALAIRAMEAMRPKPMTILSHPAGMTINGLTPTDYLAKIAQDSKDVDAAIAWVKQVEADAGRYRWLREIPCAELARQIVNDTPEGIDAAIDAAMKGQDAHHD